MLPFVKCILLQEKDKAVLSLGKYLFRGFFCIYTNF